VSGNAVRGESRAGRVLQRHRRARVEAISQLRRRPMAHAFALSLLTLALLALLLLKMGIDQFRHLGTPLSRAHALSLFLVESADQAKADALAAMLRDDPRVLDAGTISPDEGLAELMHVEGSDQALSALTDNPLPWVIVVEPRDRPAAIELADHWREHEDVAEVAEESQWRDRADAVVRTSRSVMLGLVILVVIGVLALVANAVRTIRVEGTEERALQRIFGASEADLRRPYLYLGALYGVIAGALAVIAALAVALSLRPAFTELAMAFGMDRSIAHIDWRSLLLLPAAAAMLGALGAWLACLFERDAELPA
jgi:cell division transport system permease protein